MGIWEVIGSTSEGLKRNTPDLTPLKEASRASYDYGAAACARIGGAKPIWGVISSTSEGLKRNTPDLTPLKEASRASYDYGAVACARIRANGFVPDLTPMKNATRASYDYGAAACTRIGQWMPENKTIGLYASKLAEHSARYALQEGYKLIPGGAAASKIITNTLNDVTNEKLKAEQLQVSSQKKVVRADALGKESIKRNHLNLASKM